MAALVPAGFSMMIQMGATNTLLQVMVPDRLRGRVMSLYSMMFIGMGPIGALVAGIVAARVGVPSTVDRGGWWTGLRGWGRGVRAAPALVAGRGAATHREAGNHAGRPTHFLVRTAHLTGFTAAPEALPKLWSSQSCLFPAEKARLPLLLQVPHLERPRSNSIHLSDSLTVSCSRSALTEKQLSGCAKK